MMGGRHGFNSLFPGKTLLVIVAVIASSAGFGLGYLVGQNAAVSPVPSLPKPTVSDIPPATSAQNTDAETKADAPSSAGPAESRLSAENRQAAAIPVSHEVSRQTSAPGVQSNKKDAEMLHAGQDTDRSELPGSAVSSKKKGAFTVQAASFRRQKDADALKQDLESKGYKVSIKKEAKSGGTVLFKVRVGEFQQKKEASVAALKLRTTEGLNNAFATLKK